jgi:katanin p60 ATPase-containing subunit A1
MQNIMSTSVAEICENTKLAREAALLGNYETAGVYYQGVVQQIHRLLPTINDPTNKGRWQSVRKEQILFIQRDITEGFLTFSGPTTTCL